MEDARPFLLNPTERMARAATDLIMTTLDDIEIDREADIQGFTEDETEQLAKFLDQLRWQDIYLAVSRIPLRRYSRK